MKIGFMGLGEVGSAYSSGLAKNGASVKGYDLRIDTEGVGAFRHCAEAGVMIMESVEELVRDCDVVFSVTSCTKAVETASMCKPYLTPHQVYIEANSAVPEIKAEIESMLRDVCHMVDAATLCSPSQFGVATPIAMSGPKGREVSEALNSYGMAIQSLGEKNGQASAFKVIRSIFTKGLESVMIESLSAAKRYGIMEEVFASIVSFLADEPTDQTLALMVRTNVIHAKRRGDEICEINEMLKKDHLDHTMSEAATKKLYWLGDLGLKEEFKGQKAENLDQAMEAILSKQ